MSDIRNSRINVRWFPSYLKGTCRTSRRFLIGRHAAHPARTRAGEHGFTLVELLVVLGIVGMLATLMAPRVLGYFSTAKAQTAQIQAKNITSALELYYLDVGTYPTAEQGLQALLAPPPGVAGWHGPYLKNQSGLLDPWHKRYAYRVPGRNADFDVFSQGHEGNGDLASTHPVRGGDDPG